MLSLTRHQWFNSLSTGFVICLDNIITAVAFATVILQGSTDSFIPALVGVFLICTMIVGISALVRSSLKYSIYQLQDESAILYSALALTVVQSMPAGTRPEVVFVSVVAMMGLTTLITGFVFYIMGQAKLGRISRYLPYPVIGGFLAATGWLIIVGTLSMLVGHSITHSNVLQLFTEREAVLHWLPALVVALAIFAFKKKANNSFGTFVILALAVAAFYIIVWLLQVDISVIFAKGFLLGPFNESHFVSFEHFSWIKEIQWVFSPNTIGTMCVVVLVSFIALLLNASSVELAVNENVDLDKELKTAGISNILNGMIGGTVGYLSLAHTVNAHKQGATSKITGLVAVLPAVLVLFLGGNVIAYLPKFVMGGFLFYIALSFLQEWLVETFKTLKLYEFATIAFILLTAILTSMLVAVACGIIVSLFIFVFRYSLINPIKFHFAGDFFNSTLQRPPRQKKILQEYGWHIQYYKLQGFLFFGSMYRIFETVSKTEKKSFVILDLELVNETDSSRIIIVKKLRQMALRDNFTIIICAYNAELKEALIDSKLIGEGEKYLKFFDSGEQALQWCEDQVLTAYLGDEADKVEGFSKQLQNLGFPQQLAEFLSKNTAVRKATSNTCLCKMGDEAHSMYFIHKGRVSVFIGNKRIFTVGHGNIVGEMSLYTLDKRSATLITDTTCDIYELTKRNLETLTAISPEFASEFHQTIVTILADRLVTQNRQLQLMTSHD